MGSGELWTVAALDFWQLREDCGNGVSAIPFPDYGHFLGGESGSTIQVPLQASHGVAFS